MQKITSHDQLIEHILASKSFADSEKSRQLLKYLYNQSLHNRIPRETDIAIDVFKRGHEFNPAEDTIVRVALHKLRHKLAIYYDTEGKRDKKRVSIPRGQYQLVIEISQNKFFAGFTLSRILNVCLGLCVLFLLLFVVNLQQREKARVQQWHIIPADHPVWAGVFNSNRPVVLALGDLYLIMDYGNSLSPEVVVRHTAINSDWEFNRFLAEYPTFKERFVPHTNYHFLPEYAYSAVADLLPNFIYHNVDVTIMPASELTAEHFSSSHIIYIGYYKTTNPFHNIMSDLEFSVDIHKEIVFGLDSGKVPEGMVSPTQDPKKHHSDISYAAKISGLHGNVIFLFMGFRLSGVQDVVKQFADRERLDEITSLLRASSETFPSYFQIVSQVQGFGRRDIQSEVVDLYVGD